VVQVSNAPFPELASDADWVDLTSPTVHGTALNYAGSAGKTAIILPAMAFQWVRIKAPTGSGSGTIRAYACVDDL
jgi:hypothetical protein